MPADPTLLRLVAEAERATAEAGRTAAALRAYIETGAAEPADDLVSLKDAEAEFRISNDTARRWAKVKNLGEMVNGEWFLRRSLVRRHSLS